MTTLTILEAQKFLAEQVKDKIQILIGGDCELPNDTVFFFWEKGYEIRDTEWDYIARLVEVKVMADYNLGYHYHMALRQLWVDTEKNDTFEWWLIKLDYTTRATALKEIMI